MSISPNMLRSTSKIIPSIFSKLDSVPKKTNILDNVFRNILDEFEGDECKNIQKNIPQNDYITLQNFSNFRLMMGNLSSKECTYYHNNRHIKVLEGDVEVRFNHNENNRFKFDKKNALTIASPHFLFNTDNNNSLYIWIEETPKFQDPFTI